MRIIHTCVTVVVEAVAWFPMPITVLPFFLFAAAKSFLLPFATTAVPPSHIILIGAATFAAASPPAVWDLGLGLTAEELSPIVAKAPISEF